MKMKLVLCTALLGLLVSPAMANIVVTMDPVWVCPAPDVFTVNIVGTGEEFVAGWGFDVYYDETVIQLYDDPYGLPAITYGLDWTGVYAPPDPNDLLVDLDLAGLSFPPGYIDMSAGSVLVTLQFQYLGAGWTPVCFGDHNALGDLMEGFAIQGVSNFATVEYVCGQVCPEPSTLLLLGLGGLALIRRR